MIYQKIVFMDTFIIKNIVNGIERFIPEDESNTDYKEYLAWLSEGNEPEIIES